MPLLTVWKSGGVTDAASAEDTFTYVPLGDTVHYPYVRVDISFTSTPTGTPTWSEVTPYVRSLVIRRGRQDELARVEASTLEVVLDNQDGRFDPTNTSSPYSPNVLPLRQIRVRASWDGVIYNRFRGLTEAMPMTWPSGGFDDVVTLTAVDNFKMLNIARLGMAFDEALSNGRTEDILDAAGVPAGLRSLQTGVHTIAASGTLVDSPLEHLLATADAEGGLAFVDAGGTYVLQNRRHRITSEGSSRGTFGDGSGELGYRDLAASFDDLHIWNRANVTWSAGSGVTGGTETITDTSSTATYGIRGRDLATELAKPGEAAATASLITFLYADPSLRFPAIELVGASDPTNLWPVILGAELSERYTVTRRPPSGQTITQDVYVEGVDETITPDSWTDVLNLSPAYTLDEWVLGTSELGVDTYVGI